MTRILLTLGLVGCSAPDLFENVDVDAFQSVDGDLCAGDVVSAATIRPPATQISTVAIHQGTVYTFLDVNGETTLVVLDGRRPGHLIELSRLPLPGVRWVHTARVHDGRLLASWSRPDEFVVGIDVSDPLAPKAGKTLVLGPSGQASNFAFDGDLAWTDGGDVHAIDLSVFPSLRGHELANHPPLVAPTMHGGRLLVSESDSVFADTCDLALYDTDHTGLTESSRVALDGCARQGLVGDGGSLWGLDLGAAGDLSVRSMDAAGTVSAAAVGAVDRVGHLRLLRNSAAFLTATGLLAKVQVADVTGHAVAEWSRRGAYAEGMDTQGSVAWLTVSHEDGSFEGIVAVDFSRCGP